MITGGSGMLGYMHAEAIASAGGVPVLLDLAAADPQGKAERLEKEYGVEAIGFGCDITDPDDVSSAMATVMAKLRRVDILINNAANNPKIEGSTGAAWSRLEDFPLEVWEADLAVGLTGAFLCSRVFGSEMARRK